MGLEAMRAASSNGALGSGDSWVTDLLSQAQTAKRGQSWYPGPALPPLASLHSHLIEPWEWFGNSCLAPVQFSSVQSLSCVLLFAIPWTAACQAPLSITNSWSLLKLMSIESVMPSNHLVLCRPLLLLPSIFPSIRVFSNESVLCIRWLKFHASHWLSKSVLPLQKGQAGLLRPGWLA